MFAAMLDNSVLWPSLQRDFLLSLAVEGLYRPLWSTAILDELRYHEARKPVGRGHYRVLAEQRSQRLVNQMSREFDGAIVANWEALEGTFGLPDIDDEHVAAAAMVGGAAVIVTSNLKDSPPQRIPNPVKVISPAQFAADTVVAPGSPGISGFSMMWPEPHKSVPAVRSVVQQEAEPPAELLSYKGWCSSRGVEPYGHPLALAQWDVWAAERDTWEARHGRLLGWGERV